MSFDTFFRLISFCVVFCGFLSLWVAGGVGVLFSAGFVGLIVAAWFFDRRGWLMPEKLGTAFVFVAIPLLIVAWRYRLIGAGAGESALAAVLARVILGLSIVKLFQRKTDRDWLFLYLMSFFEILLSAALSISAAYLGILIVYLLVVSLAIIAFEIRKSSRAVADTVSVGGADSRLEETPFRRLPATAVSMLLLIIAFAAPLFFVLPRVGGAGFGANQSGISGMTGFSKSVRLGEIGRIQQSDETVMRVKIDSGVEYAATGLRWRGIALDHFDNFTWVQSDQDKQVSVRGDRDAFLVGFRSERPKIMVQTVYLEPMDTGVLFTQARPLYVQGSFQQILRDRDDGLSILRQGYERITYTVQSDRFVPDADRLRRDVAAYAQADTAKYAQLPADLDPRIAALADEVTAGHANRYDKARVIEDYLQTKFGYTLEQKSGGSQPVADFLFNVREGHCEYFASAMVLMLRTQGIAARVVNGFQQGDYNETADAYIVKQKDAHSWVEVYFPGEKTWATFDPTPFAGRDGADGAPGILASFGNLVEAFETFWIQYFVAYDNQEQRSLWKSLRDGFASFQTFVSEKFGEFQTRVRQWWSDVRGESGFQASVRAIARGSAVLMLIVAAFYVLRFGRRFLKRLGLASRLRAWFARRNSRSAVAFYDRMIRILARRGHRREPGQTPLEFAEALGIPEAVALTERYNGIRFGARDLTAADAGEIESLLRRLEDGSRNS